MAVNLPCELWQFNGCIYAFWNWKWCLLNLHIYHIYVDWKKTTTSRIQEKWMHMQNTHLCDWKWPHMQLKNVYICKKGCILTQSRSQIFPHAPAVFCCIMRNICICDHNCKFGLYVVEKVAYSLANVNFWQIKVVLRQRRKLVSDL